MNQVSNADGQATEPTVVKDIRLICRECNNEMPWQKGGFYKCITVWCECNNFQVEVELVIK